MEFIRAETFKTHIVLWASLRGRSASVIVGRGSIDLRWHSILRMRWRVVGVVHGWAQRLSVGTINGGLALMRIDGSTSPLWWHCTCVAKMRVGGMGRDEGLRLGRNGCENTFLLEALTVGTTSILGGIKSRAPNLFDACQHRFSDAPSSGMLMLHTLRRRQ